MTGADPDHSDDEERFITFGMSTDGNLLVVSYTNEVTVSESSVLERQLG